MFCKSQQICTTLDLSYVFKTYIVKHKWGVGGVPRTSCSSLLPTVMSLAVTSLGGLKPTSSDNCSRSFHHRAPPRHSPDAIKQKLNFLPDKCMLGLRGAGQRWKRTPQNFVLLDVLRKPFVAVDVDEIQLTTILQAKQIAGDNIEMNAFLMLVNTFLPLYFCNHLRVTINLTTSSYLQNGVSLCQYSLLVWRQIHHTVGTMKQKNE